MLSKYRIVLLGLVVFCGSSFVAMDKKIDKMPESPRIEEASQKNMLSCSTELRNQAEKNRNTVKSGYSYYLWHDYAMRISISQRMAPYPPGEFSGH